LRGQRIKQCSHRAEAGGAEEGHAADAVDAGQATLCGDAAAVEHVVEPEDVVIDVERPPNTRVALLLSRSKGGKVYG
jgi:hypothetical protein